MTRRTFLLTGALALLATSLPITVIAKETEEQRREREFKEKLKALLDRIDKNLRPWHEKFHSNKGKYSNWKETTKLNEWH